MIAIISWLCQICMLLGLFFGAFGILYFGFALMIKGIVNLEGVIRTEKV